MPDTWCWVLNTGDWILVHVIWRFVPDTLYSGISFRTGFLIEVVSYLNGIVHFSQLNQK